VNADRLATLSDELLLDRFREGEARAFEELMRRHRTPIFHFILRSVKNPATADEILQDAWLRMIQGAREFQRASRFTTWAYTVARNLCIDHARKAVHRRHPSLDQPRGEDEGATLGDGVAANDAGADRNAIGHQLQRSLVAAIESLPNDQREVFVMREYSNLSFKEIADVVGAPENTVKSRMRYALERLQSSLVEYEDYARTLG
jgi:RNA polymerase sigma-70 factor (ECF subfamily)